MKIEVQRLEWWIYEGEDVIIVRDQHDRISDCIDVDASVLMDFLSNSNPLDGWNSHQENTDYEDLSDELQDTTNLLASRSENGIRIYEPEICEQRPCKRILPTKPLEAWYPSPSSPAEDDILDAEIRSCRQLLLDMLVIHLASDHQTGVTMIEQMMWDKVKTATEALDRRQSYASVNRDQS